MVGSRHRYRSSSISWLGLATKDPVRNVRSGSLFLLNLYKNRAMLMVSMKQYIYKIVFPIVLLAMLLLSCAGGAIGMMLHMVPASTAVHHDVVSSEAVHQCCTIEQAAHTLPTGNMFFSHHDVPDIILSKLGVSLLLIALWIVSGITNRSSLRYLWHHTKNRMQHTLGHIVRILQLRSLFSTGILYSQSW